MFECDSDNDLHINVFNHVFQYYQNGNECEKNVK